MNGSKISCSTRYRNPSNSLLPAADCVQNSFSMKPENLLNGQPLTTQKCTLGCPILDKFLSGGIPCNSITEIVAESGCGKTQLCLQLLLSSQLPPSLGGLSSSALCIYTEFPFPFRRLRQLSVAFQSAHSVQFPSPSFDPLDNILLHAAHNADHLFDVLSKLDSFLCRRSLTRWPVKLIVIDSIAALFRSEFDNTSSDLKRRSCLFFRISGKLKSLAKKFGLAVLITNQVVDFMGSVDGISGIKIGNLGSLYSSGRRVCPALGLAWANCVNTRLFLSRCEEIVGEERSWTDVGGEDCVVRRNRRHVHVVFAPHLPPSSCEFQILREGVFGVAN